MKLTTELLLNATDMSPDAAMKWREPLEVAIEKFLIVTPKRVAAFLAQVGHESASFHRTDENLNYSAKALRATFAKYFPNDESAAAFARKPEKIASRVYADRMGNGAENTGDGWKYRGRGLIQITGKTNYAECGKALGMDLILAPHLLEAPLNAAMSAAWYWHSRGLNPIADDGHFELLTKRINGGLHGFDDRKARWEKAKVALGV